MTDRNRLATLTARWRERHDARRPHPESRPLADPEREARAASVFPYRDVSPDAYVAEHGEAMIGFTYDDVRYADPALDAWLLEVGRLLHERAGR
jgi:hypothetical protein